MRESESLQNVPRDLRRLPAPVELVESDELSAEELHERLQQLRGQIVQERRLDIDVSAIVSKVEAQGQEAAWPDEFVVSFSHQEIYCQRDIQAALAKIHEGIEGIKRRGYVVRTWTNPYDDTFKIGCKRG